VVNVGPATGIIRTGDVLHLDAHRGRVTVLSRRVPAPVKP
jgi:hypothetical protein